MTNNNTNQPHGGPNHNAIDWDRYDVIMVGLWKEGKSDKQVEKQISELAESEGRTGGISLKSVKNRKKKYASELRGSKALVYTSKDDVLQQLIRLSNNISIASSGGTIIDSSLVPDKKKRKILNYHFKSFRNVYQFLGNKPLSDPPKPLEQKLVEKLRSLDVEFKDGESFENFLRRCKAAVPATSSSDSLHDPADTEAPVTPVRSALEPFPIQGTFNITPDDFPTAQYNARYGLAQTGYNPHAPPWHSGMYSPSTMTDVFAPHNMSVFSADDQPHASPATSTHTTSALTTCSPARRRDWVRKGEDASHQSRIGGLGMPADKPSSQLNQRDFVLRGTGLGTGLGTNSSSMNLPSSHMESDLNINHDSRIPVLEAFVQTIEEFIDPRTATPPISLPTHQADTVWTPLGQLSTQVTHQPQRSSARSERSQKRIKIKVQRNQSVAATSEHGSYAIPPSASQSLPYLKFPSDRAEGAQPLSFQSSPIVYDARYAYQQYNMIHPPSNFSVSSAGTIVDAVPKLGRSTCPRDLNQAAPPMEQLDWSRGMVPGMVPDDCDPGETRWLLNLVSDPEDPQRSSGDPFDLLMGHSSDESAMPIQMSGGHTNASPPSPKAGFSYCSSALSS